MFGQKLCGCSLVPGCCWALGARPQIHDGDGRNKSSDEGGTDDDGASDVGLTRRPATAAAATLQWTFAPIMRCFPMLLSFPTLLAAFRAPLGSRRLFRQVSTRSLPPEAMTFSASDVSEDEDEEESFEGPPPLCINCLNFMPDPAGNVKNAKCAEFRTRKLSDIEADAKAEYLVSGVVSPPEAVEYHHCSFVRSSDRWCGYNGKYFEPRDGVEDGATEEEGETK